jgi:hypothetical protein
MNDIFNENVSLKTETPAFAKHVLPAVPCNLFGEEINEIKSFKDLLALSYEMSKLSLTKNRLMITD